MEMSSGSSKSGGEITISNQASPQFGPFATIFDHLAALQEASSLTSTTTAVKMILPRKIPMASLFIHALSATAGHEPPLEL
jgi:hypothetical protein